MPVRVASLNVNKGTYSLSRRARLLAWLEQVAPAVLVLNEPWPKGQQPIPAFDALRFVAGNSNVAAYALEPSRLAVVHLADRWLTLDLGGAALHGVYFPANKADGPKRAAFLGALAEAAAADTARPHLIAGDFNFGPLEGDGLYDGKPSTYTSRREREALERLFEAGGVVDATRPGGTGTEFTLERPIRGKLSQWRCDLALVDAELHRSGRAKVSVDHRVRKGGGAFTDHSALVLDLSLDLGNASRVNLAPPSDALPPARPPTP